MPDMQTHLTFCCWIYIVRCQSAHLARETVAVWDLGSKPCDNGAAEFDGWVRGLDTSLDIERF